jgi:hypothetical protein
MIYSLSPEYPYERNEIWWLDDSGVTLPFSEAVLKVSQIPYKQTVSAFLGVLAVIPTSKGFQRTFKTASQG